MEALVKGDVVVIPFPFSDLSASKKRPALVVTSLEGDDLILCQITSKERFDNYALSLAASDFKTGQLAVESVIRPNRLFTADRAIIDYKIGTLKQSKIIEVVDKICKIIKN